MLIPSDNYCCEKYEHDVRENKKRVCRAFHTILYFGGELALPNLSIWVIFMFTAVMVVGRLLEEAGYFNRYVRY